jgi:hypothetical protein
MLETRIFHLCLWIRTLELLIVISSVRKIRMDLGIVMYWLENARDHELFVTSLFLDFASY